MTTYLGLDLLDLLPHREDDPSPASQWGLDRFDPLTGKLVVDAVTAAARVGRPGVWYVRDRTALQTMRDFVTARGGRRVPFWLPTWQNDLPLVQSASSSAGTLVVRETGYARFTFGAETFARRYLAILTAGGAVVTPKKIVAATDNEDGTETLTVDGTLGVDVTPASTMLSFLTYVRLADDEVVFRHLSQNLAVVLLPTIEIPTETPTF